MILPLTIDKILKRLRLLPILMQVILAVAVWHFIQFTSSPNLTGSQFPPVTQQQQLCPPLRISVPTCTQQQLPRLTGSHFPPVPQQLRPLHRISVPTSTPTTTPPTSQDLSSHQYPNNNSTHFTGSQFPPVPQQQLHPLHRISVPTSTSTTTPPTSQDLSSHQYLNNNSTHFTGSQFPPVPQQQQLSVNQV